MSGLIIRTATVQDAALIADMSRQTFYETFASQNTPENMDKFMNEQFSREKLMAEVGAPDNIFLLAIDGADAVGYVRLLNNSNPDELPGKDSIEVVRIYALASSIGKGVGKALMMKCIDIAQGLNKDIIWLGVWEHNQRAIEFYSRLGFEKFSTHVFQLGNDPQTDWLMKKELKP